MLHPLTSLFYPQSIAVIGASDRYGSTGRNVFGWLLANAAAAQIVPVNPNHKTIAGLKTYDSLHDAVAEHQCDTAVVILKLDKLGSIIREAAKAGVANIVFINEIDPTPPHLHSKFQRTAATAAKHGIRLIAMPASGLRGLYQPDFDNTACAYIGQSAGIADCMAHYAEERDIRFSRFITLNPQPTPVNCGKIIAYAAAESQTAALLVHISSLEDAQELLSALTAAARAKPVVVLSTLAENSEAQLFHQALARRNILTVHSLTDFLTSAKLIHTGILSQGTRLSIISNTPQIGALMLNTLPKTGGTLAEPANSTLRALNKLLPGKQNFSNPIYLPADAAPKIFQNACEICLNDEHSDAVVLLYAGLNPAESYRVAKIIAPLQQHCRKPLLLVWLGSADQADVRTVFKQHRNLHFKQPEHALHAFGQLNHYRRHQQQRHQTAAFYDYRHAEQAAEHLHKHLKPLLPLAVLPATKSNTTAFLDALNIRKAPSQHRHRPDALHLMWEKREPFGQVLTLSNAETFSELLPPLTPESAAKALAQLELPAQPWNSFLLDSSTILSRLPEIHSCQLTLHTDAQHSISCSDIKIHLQEPDSYTGSPNIIAPYPDHSERLTLPNKNTVWLRPIRAEDAQLISRFVAALDEDSRYSRFMSKSPELPPAQLSRMSRPDYRNEYALIMLDKHNIPLATASYTADANGSSCEFGIIITPSLQGQGVGSLLMQRLNSQARAQGYRRMRAEILSDNHAMQKLALKLGFVLSKHPNDHHIVNAVLDW